VAFWEKYESVGLFNDIKENERHFAFPPVQDSFGSRKMWSLTCKRACAGMFFACADSWSNCVLVLIRVSTQNRTDKTHTHNSGFTVSK
jgi:hypothetical protein